LSNSILNEKAFSMSSLTQAQSVKLLLNWFSIQIRNHGNANKMPRFMFFLAICKFAFFKDNNNKTQLLPVNRTSPP